MKYKKILILKAILLFAHSVIGQNKSIDKYWEISSSQSIVWKLDEEHRYPHEDNIEMSGDCILKSVHDLTNINFVALWQEKKKVLSISQCEIWR